MTFNGLQVIFIMGDITDAKAEVTVNQIVPECTLDVGMGRAFVKKCGHQLKKDFQSLVDNMD